MRRVPAVQSSSGTLPTSLIRSSCQLKIPIKTTYAASSHHGLSLRPPWEVLITCCRETSQKNRSTKLQTFLSHVKSACQMDLCNKGSPYLHKQSSLRAFFCWPSVGPQDIKHTYLFSLRSDKIAGKQLTVYESARIQCWATLTG